MKRAILSVTNDLTTDQRVHRTCMTLTGEGYDVVLTGRRRTESIPLAPRTYPTERMRLLFEKGFCFYAEFNLRLFFRLLFSKADLLVSNDTDTLPAVFLAARLRGIPHLHDCHEYFRGVPELVGRRCVTNVWKWIEDRIFPRLRHVAAVNDSVANLYRSEYDVPVSVVRNVPFRRQPMPSNRKEELGIPADRKVILYQGAVNMDRGLEETIQAMHHVTTDAVFVIIGDGDVYKKLTAFAERKELKGKVLFTGAIPMEDLYAYTCMADLGLSVEKETGVNYQNCLPNKFLDYIQARVPVLVTPFPEMKHIVDQYGIGRFINNHDPVHLAQCIDAMLGDPSSLKQYRKNLEQAAADLCWEHEVHVLKKLLQNIR